jgi:hypothetical protein
MINDHGLDECIRGRLATLRFTPHTVEQGGRRQRRGPGMDIQVEPQQIGSGPTGPSGRERQQARTISTTLEGDDTAALWQNFLDCVRTRNRATLSTPELGAAAFTTVNMGVLSYRQGQVLYWDRERRQPVPADSNWASRLERRSRERGRPSQVAGWAGGDRGSVVIPPDYQRLGGPWTNDRDPADGAAGGGS